MKPSYAEEYKVRETVMGPIFDQLLQSPEDFPVTLVFCNGSNLCHLNRDLIIRAGGRSKVSKDSPFVALHSDQDPTVVSRVLSDLVSERPTIKLILTTSYLGMGFDSPHVSRVIHYEPPSDLIDYVQQIGRCGRNGQQAEAILYYNATDLGHVRQHPGGKEVDKFCKHDGCFRKALMEYYHCTVATLENCCNFCSN